MTDTAHKQIMDKIGARLALITTGNGYYFSAGLVKQVTTTPLQPYDFPRIYYAQTSDTIQRTAYHNERHSLTVAVYSYTLTNETAAHGAVASEIGGAIVTALNRAPGAPLVSDAISKDLGDTVQELTPETFSYQVGEGQTPYLGVTLTLRIIYTAPIGDMFTVEN